MKKLMCILISAVLTLSLAACSNTEPAPVDMEPKTSQMKAICELAVMDCYYHNVAKYELKDAEGFLWWTKDKNFWIEYSGVVTIGIDVSRVTVEVNGTKVTISIPAAEVLSCTVDSSSLTEDSFIVAQDSAAIEAEDEVYAFADAQAKLEETASQDTALLASAQQQAQQLLEDYITNIGKATGKSYSIEWIYLDENKKNKLYVNDIAYIPHEKCGFYVMTGKSDAGVQYMYIADFKNGSIDVRHVNVSLENGEMYEKLLVEGQFVYVLTNKAVYTIKTGRNGTNLATSGSLAKYADIDRKLIKDINMITVGGARVLVGFGANNNLYVIGRGAENFSVKSYGGTLTNLIEFNGGLFSVADGNLNSEKVSYVPAENKSLISQLCTYKVNILDKKKRLVENYPSDGKFTVEYYAETIDRIIFENEGYGENSAAQNRLPVSVVFAVYNADTGLLADVRVNNFMLDYAYVSESPEDSIGSLLKCEETFNLGKGNYYAKIMTFKGNNFYWPKKNESTDTLDVFAKTLGE